MSIAVVSLNPCIDRQVTVLGFVYGGLNRVQEVGRYASGKGINVCAALANLGQNPLCTGINFSQNGAFITNALDEWGVKHDFVTVDGAVRINIKLYDTTTGTMTELNQPGCFVPEADLAQLYTKIKNIDAQILVLSGSMPAGVPAGFYKQLCEIWPGKVILDAEGEALITALTGGKPPFCIKPNLYELESCFGVKLPTKEDIAAFCKKLLHEYKLGIICVSMGADGALLVSHGGAFFMPGLDLTVRGLQGAGDAMVAGLACGLIKNAQEPVLLQMASAAAAASIVREGSLMCTKEDYKNFLQRYKSRVQLI
ncbi:MAG: 1-phosphofructokinase family hexose kinase [Defluviitaleaceae bacterium]|nr:1-phosphofructokinase family hexose kinase [Defluviitaleaceae bacterium]